jgi:hypothetical protein
MIIDALISRIHGSAAAHLQRVEHLPQPSHFGAPARPAGPIGRQ